MKHLLLISALAILLCGCDKKARVTDNRNRKTNITIDTVFIHEQKHEILVYEKFNLYYGYSGMMHSPECWCQKKGE